MNHEPPTPEPEDLLARVPLFARLGRGELRKLGRLCIPKGYVQGTLVIQEGAVGLGLFLITSGRVEVFKGGEGPERIVLAELGAGDILGELAVIDDEARSASARALVDTACLLITRDSFQTLLRTEPEVAWCIVPVLTERIREMQRRMLADEAGGAAHAAAAESAPEAPATAEAAGEAEPPAGRDALVRLLRAQYALTLAAATGLSGVVRAGEAFVETLAREAHLAGDERAGEVVRRLPAGLAAAARAALEEGERVPERMLSRLLRHLERDPK